LNQSDTSFSIGLFLLILGVMIMVGAGIAKGKEIMILESAK
jgi:uncharacterized membrane protein YkvI